MTRIDRKTLCLVIPVERDDGSRLYVHSMPLAYETFVMYHLVLAKTFSAFYTQGLTAVGGPRIAAMLLQDVAQETARIPGVSWWEGTDGVENGLMVEMRRLSNVVVPKDDGQGWTTVPLEDALTNGLLDKEEAGEAINQVAFFTVVSATAPRGDKEGLLTGGARMSNSQIVSLNATEYAASLRTLTTDDGSGKRTPAPRSSVPR